MKTYQTAQIAMLSDIHPNTVRLYEQIGFITKPERTPGGYRVFTDLHVQQVALVRTALQIPMVQNGLRKLAVRIVQASAACDFEGAYRLSGQYMEQICAEQANAEEALAIVKGLLHADPPGTARECLTRSEVAHRLSTTMDTLRNWEMNGLLTVKRRRNGYRIYTDEDIRRLKVIRALRTANYSLAAILRLLNTLHENPDADIRATLNTPHPDEDIVSVCDQLLTSLCAAETNARLLLAQTRKLKKQFPVNPPL